MLPISQAFIAAVVTFGVDRLIDLNIICAIL